MAQSSFSVDKLSVQVYNSRNEMGEKAALFVAIKIADMLLRQETVNMVFAAAPSQIEFLRTLIKLPNIEWNRINAFHMDEYIGIDAGAPQSFGQFLKNALFDWVPFKAIYYINPFDPEVECRRYTALLESYPPDIVCLGIGENGHLAFNDPSVADFKDDHLVKIVELEASCRQQQVNDGCFDALEQVPLTAITLTIPALMSAQHISAVVPGSTKAQAVHQTLNGEISTTCPASILRTHADAVLHVDDRSYPDGSQP